MFIFRFVKSLVRKLPEEQLKYLRSVSWLFKLNSVLVNKYRLNISTATASTQRLTYKRFTKKESFILPENEGGVQVAILVDELNSKKLKLSIESVFESQCVGLVLCNVAEISTINSFLDAQFGNKKVKVFSDLASILKNVSSTINTLLIYQGDQVSTFLPTASHEFSETTSQLGYSDFDYLDSNCNRASPVFLPDWNTELHYSTGVYATGLWLKDLRLLRCIILDELLNRTGIAHFLLLNELKNTQTKPYHIKKIMVHRDVDNEVFISEWERVASKHLSQDASIRISPRQTHLDITWNLERSPLVTLIIPTRNGKRLLEQCIDSIFNKTDYKNFEIIVVDNNSDESDTLDYLDGLSSHEDVTVIKYPHEFNYSAINNYAVKFARGEIIGLVNNDIEVISPNWLCSMLSYAIREDIGCVGARLLYPDDTIQHAGVVIGLGGGAGHAHKHFPDEHDGYLKRISATSNFSAVTGACLLVKKEHYELVGGLNETRYPVAFNDVDFCLRVLGLGVRNVYCASAKLYHHESVSRGQDDTLEKRKRFNMELTNLKEDWQFFIDDDPAYNPNLTLDNENFGIKVC